MSVLRSALLLLAITTVAMALCRGGDACCNGQCGVGEGDCDSHYDCRGNLLCGNNNCNGRMLYNVLYYQRTFDTTDDCCYDSNEWKEQSKF